MDRERLVARPGAPAFEQAIAACKDLQPAGFTGASAPPSSRRRPSSSPSASATTASRTSRTRSPRAPRRHEQIPSADTDGGMSILNAAMQTCSDLAAPRPGRAVMRGRVGAAGRPVLVCRGRHVAGVVACRRDEVDRRPPRSRRRTPRRWSGGSSRPWSRLAGTLTYRARSDGSPYSVINQARGTYTELPDAGDEVDCGDVLYRVDDDPVLLLCGAVPAYRDLHDGDEGNDVRQLNRNLHAARLRRRRRCIDPDDDGSPADAAGARAAPARQGPGTRPERLTSAMRSSCPSRCGSPR